MEKIKEVIGSGGKVVQKICADYNVKVDIEEDGRVFISGESLEMCESAKNVVESIVKEGAVGEVYTGKVTRLTAFGAFIEFAPGKEGLCHISQLSEKRVENVTDAVNVGDSVVVKIVRIDEKGRINLTKKNALK